MSTLTIILLVVAILIALPFVLALFVPKEMHIEKEVMVNKPVGEIYNYIKYLRNSEQYNKWVMTDPNMKKEYVGTDGTVGFVYKWDSQNKQVGQGEQEIMAMDENKRVDYELRFIKPFPNTSKGYMVTEAAGNSTKVKYGFRGPSNYFMRVMQIVLNIKKMLGRDMMTTLTNLKRIMEK